MSKRAGLQTTIIVALLAMVGPFAIDTIFPGFARIGVQFGVSDAQLQQITSVYLLSFALTSLFHGPISDAVGRKPVMIAGMGMFAIASVGCALAPNLPVLIGFRVLQGLSAGAGQIISRALVRDLYEGVQAQRVMAQVSMIFGVAPALAPIVGGWLLQVGDWHIIFAFLAGYGLLLVALVTFGLPETHLAESRTPLRVGAVLSSVAQVSRSGQFMRLAFASSFGFAAQFTYIVAAPIFIVRLLGLGETDFWVFFVPLISGLMFGSWLNSRLAARVSQRRMASAGFTFIALAALVNLSVGASSLATSLPWPIIGPAISSFGTALAFPVLQLQMLDLFPTRRGAAASLQSFVALLLNAALAGIIVPLVSGTVLSLAVCSAVFAALGVLLWAWHLRGTRA